MVEIQKPSLFYRARYVAFYLKAYRMQHFSKKILFCFFGKDSIPKVVFFGFIIHQVRFLKTEHSTVLNLKDYFLFVKQDFAK